MLSENHESFERKENCRERHEGKPLSQFPQKKNKGNTA